MTSERLSNIALQSIESARPHVIDMKYSLTDLIAAMKIVDYITINLL